MKLVLPLLALALSGCGTIDVVSHLSSSGDEITGTGKPIVETRKAQVVSKIQASGALHVEVRQGRTPKLTVEAQKEILPFIQSRFEKGRLMLSMKSGSLNTEGPLKVRYSTPRLHEVEASGATTVTAAGFEGKSGRIVLSGASKIKASGRVESLVIDVSGASQADLKTLQVRDAKVDSSGASQVWIRPTGSLAASASGASTIRYAGSPKSLKKETSGASSVEQTK